MNDLKDGCIGVIGMFLLILFPTILFIIVWIIARYGAGFL